MCIWLLCLNGLTTGALSGSAIWRERVKLLRSMAEVFFSDESEKVVQNTKFHFDPRPQKYSNAARRNKYICLRELLNGCNMTQIVCVEIRIFVILP